jgi:8-oxo-dGTP pyrophosphatase MutT (NUDIX family)
MRGVTVEFLLVNTSAGKWTFPKGRLEPSLSASQSAEREAWEEAGALGLIESAEFGWYIDTKRAPGQENGVREIVVAAYMLEVHTTVTPEERDRNPTWFSPEEAKRKLVERRLPKYSARLAGLVDAALRRITQPQTPARGRQTPRSVSLFLHR